MTEEKLLRADQVARMLGVTARQVRWLWQERRLLGVKLSERVLRFRLQDVQEYQRQINALD